MNRNKAWLGALALALASMVGIGVVQIRAADVNGPVPAAAPAVGPVEGDLVFGIPEAPKTVLALVSLTCTHCQRWEAEQMPEVQRRLVATGRIRLIVRDFPLNQPALAAATVVRCLPEAERAEAHRRLLSRMSEWAGSDPARMADVVGLAGSGASRVLACAARSDIRDAILAKQQAVIRDYGIKATPSFVIDGQIMTGGLPEADIERLIDGPRLPVGEPGR